VATTVQPFIVGGRWPRRLELAALVPEVVRGVTGHAAEYTERGVAVVVGVVPPELVAATESDPRIRAAALTDHRLRQLRLAVFTRVPLAADHLRELAVIGVVFAVWTLLPGWSEATMKAFMGTVVVQPEVVRAEPDAVQHSVAAALAAFARCEAVAHGGDADLLPQPPPGRPV
jgi:hypothetical protein